MGRKFYITTAIDYVNNLPHLGTSYEKVCADIIARYARLLGWDVLFLMGNDEHSVNVERRAKMLGLDPIKYCDKMEEEFTRIWKKLDLTYDVFIRTTWKKHSEAVIEIFKRLTKKNLIYKSFYKGLYCQSCENYVKKSELVEGKCPTHKIAPIELEEENYFFRLSALQEELKRLFRENEKFVRPENRRNEMLAILEDELEDISISRTSFTFGIPVPDDPKHIIYVWFDALINYITGCGFLWDMEKFNHYWPADIHIIGKDITRFHSIVWPAMLIAADIKVPNCIFAHGFLHLGSEKMSKTLGNIVSPETIVDKYGGDILRFFFVKEFPFGEDGSFTEENLQKRYTSELANEWGNLIQRLTSLKKNYNNLTINKSSVSSLSHLLHNKLNNLYNSLETNILNCDLFSIVNSAWNIIKEINTDLDKIAPWKLARSNLEEATRFVDGYLIVCLYLNNYLQPILPATYEKIKNSLLKDIKLNPYLTSFTEFVENLPLNFEILPPPILFPKLQI